jgi:hypothetical protein
MPSVMASGLEIMMTWEPSISVMVAPARSAKERTTSAPATLSAVPTADRTGRFFHAGGPLFSATAIPAIGRYRIGP